MISHVNHLHTIKYRIHKVIIKLEKLKVNIENFNLTSLKSLLFNLLFPLKLKNINHFSTSSRIFNKTQQTEFDL